MPARYGNGRIVGLLLLALSCGRSEKDDSKAELAAQSASVEFTQRRLLFVVGEIPLSASDEAIRQRLMSLGFGPFVRKGRDVQVSDADGMAGVFISESTLSTDLADRLCGVPVGLVSSEPSVLDDCGLTGPTWGTDYGDVEQSQSLEFASIQHPLGGGLAGVQGVSSVPTKLVWGKPNDRATIVAKIAGTSRAGIFAYERGVAMVRGVAAARRAGWFAGRDAAVTFTDNGWRA